MRIPLLAVIPVCLITVALIWWLGTRDMDFLTPPSEARLNDIRADALASLPASRRESDAIAIKIPPPDIDQTRPDNTAQLEPAELGDILSQPVLDTYSDRSPDGATKLLILAAELEKVGAFQRALLANERILDLSQSDPEQIQAAISSIRRLKPTLPIWNPNPETASQAVIHIGTGEKFVTHLPEILNDITREITTASSGIVKFSHELHIGRTIENTGPATPVALWITGVGKNAPSTDVLSFTTNDPETLRHDILKTTFNLVRSRLMKSASYAPAPEALNDPLVALESHITRLLWNEFGKTLSPKP